MEKDFLIKINNSNIQFKADKKNISILDSAIKSKIKLPFGCKSGACGSCEVKLIEGKVFTSNGEEIYKPNKILLCQSFPNTAKVTLEYEKDRLEIIKENTQDSKKIISKDYVLQIVGNKSVTPLVKELSLYVPEKLNFKFLPGSHVEIFNQKGLISRKYSILNSPSKFYKLKNNILKFLIINHARDGMSTTIHNQFKVGDLIKIRGPQNSFHYKIDNNAPLLAIAGGTGISPILSIVKYVLSKNNDFNILVMLSVRSREEILEMETFFKLKEMYKNFNFKISLSRENKLANSTFLYGKIDQTLPKIFKDLSTHKVLISGSDGFVNFAYDNSIRLKAKIKNIFFEKYSKN